MNHSIVGCSVGFPVGLCGLPDMDSRIEINGLAPVCRDCRVSPTQERASDSDAVSSVSRWP
jgi:hypothetical protein